jgi:molybdopterin-guanine dinucleotide biosynthesis protein A
MITTTARNHLAIAILAGGQSRRMGRDKAELELGGQTLLERMVDQALLASKTVAVVGRSGARDDVVWMEDDQPGLGPLGGLKTALAHLDQPVLLVACDMPRVDAEALGWLLEKVDHTPQKHGLATMRDGQIEPLFSVYKPAILPLVDACIDSGRLSARRLIEDGEFRMVEAPEQVAAKLVNVNTPGEFEGIAAP